MWKIARQDPPCDVQSGSAVCHATLAHVEKPASLFPQNRLENLPSCIPASCLDHDFDPSGMRLAEFGWIYNTYSYVGKRQA